MGRHLFDALVAQYATPEVSGSGSVSWGNGVKCVIPSVRLIGAAEQETLTGSNLLDLRTGKSIDNAQGVAYENLGNGVYKVSGIATGAAGNAWFWGGYNIAPKDDGSNVLFTLLPGEYTLTDVALFTVENGVRQDVTSKSSGPATITIDETTYPNGFRVTGVRNPQQVIGKTYDTRIYPCVSKGSTALPWEPYCGGMPAPNPDYPIMPKCNNGMSRATDADGAYDGGTATAPELWAIPGTAYRDEWDTQTGRGIRRCAVIDSYAGEIIDTPYISSTGELTEGAYVVYGIPDTPFTATLARLTMPTGYGQIIQISGDVGNCPITAKYLQHR